MDHALSLNGDITVSLDSDLVASNFTGIYTGQATINATNVTFADNSKDMELFSDVTLRLDSSIVEDAIQETGTNLTCVITYSRGPTTSGDPCQTFQTSADPGFVDAALGDYHLASGSALIDKGNPTAPPSGSQDIDGDARALDGPDGGGCGGAPRRDIGADEYRC